MTERETTLGEDEIRSESTWQEPRSEVADVDGDDQDTTDADTDDSDADTDDTDPS